MWHGEQVVSGLQTFDQALVKLIEEDRVTYEEAL